MWPPTSQEEKVEAKCEKGRAKGKTRSGGMLGCVEKWPFGYMGKAGVGAGDQEASPSPPSRTSAVPLCAPTAQHSSASSLPAGLVG